MCAIYDIQWWHCITCLSPVTEHVEASWKYPNVFVLFFVVVAVLLEKPNDPLSLYGKGKVYRL